MIQKDAYPSIDYWEKINETSLRKKENFHCQLNIENITGVDYINEKNFCNSFEKKIFRITP